MGGAGEAKDVEREFEAYDEDAVALEATSASAERVGGVEGGGARVGGGRPVAAHVEALHGWRWMVEG